MARMNQGDTVVVKPASNIYTVLTAVATILVIAGVTLMWLRYKELFNEQLFGG